MRTKFIPKMLAIKVGAKRMAAHADLRGSGHLQVTPLQGTSTVPSETMASEIFLLLPPSEGKVEGGTKGKASGMFSKALQRPRGTMRQALANELRGVSTSRAETLFKVRGELLERALAATKSYVAGSALLLPAYQRYSGVVWSHLEAETLAPFTRDRILIPSGLYGVTTSSDGIADYRLTMNVSVTSISKVAAFWKPMVTEVLTQKTSGALLFDLLPNEHRAAIDGGRLAQHCELVTVNFVSHDGKKAAGHAAKAAKGMFARRILDEGTDAVQSFRWGGWSARQKGSTILVKAPKP